MALYKITNLFIIIIFSPPAQSRVVQIRLFYHNSEASVVETGRRAWNGECPMSEDDDDAATEADVAADAECAA